MDKVLMSRLFFFGAALALYGIFGSPTPDSMGWPEWISGVLFLAALPVRNLMLVFSHAKTDPLWRCSAQFLLVYSLCGPVLIALVAGHPPALVLRDIIPFLFLLLPLFYFTSGEMTPRYMWALVTMVGVFFSVRVIAAQNSDPLYLSISPCVVFAAIVLMGQAGLQLMAGLTLRRILLAVVFIVLAALCFMALAATLQRASLTLAVAALGGLLLLALWRVPTRAMAPALVVCALLIVFYNPVTDILAHLARKQGEVGLNMRLQEALAVFDAISVSPLHVLFGLGWGAQLESPAVGGMAVNYTHSLLTFIWLKTGLVGLFGVTVYLAALAGGLGRSFPKNPVLVMALAVPLLIDTFLYASFKSLDFGLILLICAALTHPAPKGAGVAPAPDLVYR